MYINNQKLILTPDHNLALYEKIYPNYDKFLNQVVEQIEKDKSVIDIGANIGDTLIRLYTSNKNLRYYSIEADDFFFKYLEKNLLNLNKTYRSNITLIKELIGSDLSGSLSGSHGTKGLIVGDKESTLKSLELDEIILKYRIENISLIKVDVDGYDYNVLSSGLKSIEKFKPLLFFEYMKLNEETLIKYNEIIEKLHKLDYREWTLLDNYGNKIIQNSDKNKILKYIYQNSNKIFDIFVKTKSH